jgi:2-amino-4-hydroxy-6-hydroxymethyldihydropteridine diphosphokinase
LSASAKDDAPHQVDVGHRAYLCLGSNIRPAENIRAAVRLLRSRAHVLALSTCWETQAVGSDGQPGTAPNFLNIAACIATPLEPGALKEQLIAPIEQALGRVRSADKYAPRTIDLDICVFDDQLLDRGLWKRSYLALTLAELLPELRDPGSGETLQAAAERQRREHLAIAHPEIVA